tara:strand:+ start:1214 stop:1747 length:534 start_codon:yes stop_codon:yes gene_type:complete
MQKKGYLHFWKKENQNGEINSFMNDKEVEEILSNSKVIAMVGVSSLKKEENPKMIRRRPSTIVMKYMQEFGYKVIPVNPFAVGEKIHGETVIDNLEDIKIPIDIVNIFRPSKETPILANQAVKIKTKVLWLQYGIQNKEAKKIATKANISYVENRCIKQEYQKIFQKMSPVFPALKL